MQTHLILWITKIRERDIECSLVLGSLQGRLKENIKKEEKKGLFVSEIMITEEVIIYNNDDDVDYYYYYYYYYCYYYYYYYVDDEEEDILNDINEDDTDYVY